MKEIMSYEEFQEKRREKREKQRKRRRIRRITGLVLAALFVIASFTISIIFINKIVKENKDPVPTPVPTAVPTSTPTPTPDYSDAKITDGKNITITVTDYGSGAEYINIRAESDKLSEYLGQIKVGTKFKVHRMLANNKFYGFYAEDVEALNFADSDGIVWISSPYIMADISETAEKLDNPEEYTDKIMPLEYATMEKIRVIPDGAGVFSKPAEPLKSRYGILDTDFVATKVYRMYDTGYIYFGFLASELPEFDTPDGDITADPDGIVWMYSERLVLNAE